MIQTKTVLILGAGASSPFGFPLGRELLNLVVEGLAQPTETELGKLLLDCRLLKSTKLKGLWEATARLSGVCHKKIVCVFFEITMS